MKSKDVDIFVQRAQAWSLIAFPALLIIVFIMHFRRLQDLLVLHAHYVPRDPRVVVTGLIARGHQVPLLHDPHVVGYLALPSLLLMAMGLYRLGRNVRPLTAGVGVALTTIGTVYQGGLFGMWTAFYSGIGGVDPRYLDGATATFAAQTESRGAFLLTTVLSRIVLAGIPIQMAALFRSGQVPDWSVYATAIGSATIWYFADLDNWMLFGTALLLIGLLPAAKALKRAGP